MWTPAAENLLLGTAATESHLGAYLFQVGGPALGIYQMEPDTFEDIQSNFLAYRPQLAAKVRSWAAQETADELVWNLAYATAVCRVHYRRDPEPLPDANDVIGMARTWKRHYNTHRGKGTEADFIAAYRTRVQHRIS